MSLEDLRDAYKNSRQNRDLKLNLNGATYRKIATGFHVHSMGNTIKKVNKEIINDDLNELNVKYALKDNNLVYSLNKKNRWQLKGDLIQNMHNYESDDVDVRLYETSSRAGNTKNLTALHTSKRTLLMLVVRMPTWIRSKSDLNLTKSKREIQK
jgi:hypothetical protein